jgi:hypothetical protein
MNHRRRLWLTIGIALVLIVSISFCAHRQYTRYERAYARLTPGTTKAEVLRQFGKPQEITKCTYVPSWDDEPVDEKSVKCVEEFRYFSRMRIGAWIVGFDADGIARTKYYSSSP